VLTLSVINHWAGNRPNAIHHAQNALLIFQDLRDLRGIGSVLGLLGEIYASTGDNQAGAYFLGFLALQRHLSTSPTPDVERDIEIRKRDLVALRTKLGVEKYLSLVPEWAGLVEKWLIPQGILEPMTLVPAELVSPSSLN
jgi:hypothetical protein